MDVDLGGSRPATPGESLAARPRPAIPWGSLASRPRPAGVKAPGSATPQGSLTSRNGLRILRGDGAMRLTTARYYTPSGRSIQALGISPDIIVEQPRPQPVDENAEEEETRTFRSEADLRGSLDNDSLTEDEIRQIQEDRERAQAAADLREEDYQLAYAIDILKGLNALGTSGE